MKLSTGRRAANTYRPAIVAVLIAVALVASACGDSEEGDEGVSSATDDTVELETVTIGQLKSATGPDAKTWGEPIDKGFQLAMAEVEESGFLNDVGIRLELDTKDDASDPTQAVTMFNEFQRDGIQLMFSSARTATGTALTPLVNDASVLYVNVGSGGTGDDEEDFYFRMNDTTGLATSNAEYIVSSGHKKPVAIVDGDIPAYVVQGPVMEEAMAAKGLNTGFLTTEKVATKDSDFSAVLTNIAQKQPDALWLGMIDATAGNLIQQMQRNSALKDVQVVGNPGTSAQLWEIAGTAAEGLVWAVPWADGAPGTEAFPKAYEETYGEAPTSWSALGYQTGWLFATAIKMAAEANDGEVTSTTVRDVWAKASTSADMKEHGLVDGFAVDAKGIPSYRGVLGTFTADGTVVLAK